LPSWRDDKVANWGRPGIRPDSVRVTDEPDKRGHVGIRRQAAVGRSVENYQAAASNPGPDLPPRGEVHCETAGYVGQIKPTSGRNPDLDLAESGPRKARAPSTTD